ncbi:MAG: hypothetical protein A3F41_06570 [Coxiella sp. RIFCSPHIGHO2_12_FULL_44_14]|nr:MAG: hypothetical protein A3F41_06570 [Coxiella sp. RIFCSPHIGHO2_12_FULL_44_14]
MKLLKIAYLRWTIPFLLFTVVAIFLWHSLHRDPHVVPSPLINKPLPHFQAPVLGIHSQRMTEQDFQGHVSLFNVFATWCLSCRTEHLVLMDIARSHAVTIYGLNYKDDHRLVLAWLKTYGNPYQQVIEDPRGDLGIDLGVYGTPETFIIDSHGIIRYKYVGPLSSSVWQNILLPQVRYWQAFLK